MCLFGDETDEGLKIRHNGEPPGERCLSSFSFVVKVRHNTFSQLLKYEYAQTQTSGGA